MHSACWADNEGAENEVAAGVRNGKVLLLLYGLNRKSRINTAAAHVISNPPPVVVNLHFSSIHMRLVYALL